MAHHGTLRVAGRWSSWFRRRRPGRAILFCAALMLAGCGSRIASSTSTGSTGTTGSAGSTGSSTNTTEPGPTLPTPPYPNPWLAYLTDVNPGTGMSFANDSDGWRLNGQDAAPHLDNNLAAGPSGTSFAWPGDSVSSSSDGGKTWNSIFSDSSGIWGFDLLSSTDGWVVGVTQLSGTTDGGGTWQELHEPSSGHLVRVDFQTPDTGFGLTVSGGLVTTTDGGTTWSNVAIGAPANALCFVDSTTGYVADFTGDVYATTDSGKTWNEAFQSGVQSQQGPTWGALACSADGAIEGYESLDGQAQFGPPPYVVAKGSSGAGSWNVVADNQTAGAPPVAGLSAVAANGSGVFLVVGFPSSGVALQAAQLTSSNTFTDSTMPPVDTGGTSVGNDYTAPGYLNLLGISMVGQSGWMYFSDSAVGTADNPMFEDVELTTTDSGSSWTVAHKSTPASGSPTTTVATSETRTSGGT